MCRGCDFVSDVALQMRWREGLGLMVSRHRWRPPCTWGPVEQSEWLDTAECAGTGEDEEAKWLQAAFDGDCPFAKMHLAYLTFYAGQEDVALAHLKEYLSWRVQRGRDICGGCGQSRGENTPMLTCIGCRVERFCSANLQKMASKKAALGGNLLLGRHKDICGVLSKWRKVVKNGVAPDSCTAELVAFLQRENARFPRTQRKRQRQFSHNVGPGRRPAERGRESVLE